MIKSVTDKNILLANGEVINYDLLIWTGGVKAVELPFVQAVKSDKKSRCLTENGLTLCNYPDIYLVGDNACVIGKDSQPMPQTATQAIDHGEFVTRAIFARLNNQPAPKFQPKPSPFIIQIKERWAIMYLPSGFIMSGFWAWFIKQFVAIDYFYRLMPLHKAIKLAWFGQKIFNREE